MPIIKYNFVLQFKLFSVNIKYNLYILNILMYYKQKCNPMLNIFKSFKYYQIYLVL